MPSRLGVLAGISQQVVGSDPFPRLPVDALFAISRQEAGSSHSLLLTDAAGALIAVAHQAAVATHHRVHRSLRQ